MSVLDPTLVFYMVDAPDVNEEIFHDRESADTEFEGLVKLGHNSRLSIVETRQAYLEEEGDWNYDDSIDCFKVLLVLRQSGPAIHAAGCNGFHTSCIECSNDDNLNICVTEFGAPELCSNHDEEADPRYRESS